jgi:hypothetical protein
MPAGLEAPYFPERQKLPGAVGQEQKAQRLPPEADLQLLTPHG